MENKILRYDRLDSTNTKVQEFAKAGEPEGLVVVAESQTAGKGRYGRTWESPAGSNIYMSLLLRPNISILKAPMLTLVMAYSIAKVLKEQGYDGLQIKWPNDLVIKGKKICGILTETYMAGSNIDYVVVGIGINANETTFPSELLEKASSLYLEGGEKVDRSQLSAVILNQFAADYEEFLKREDLTFLQEQYNEMLVNCGKEVRVLEPGKEYAAVALGINEKGELLVEKADGSKEAVFAGEVSVRGVYGYV